MPKTWFERHAEKLTCVSALLLVISTLAFILSPLLMLHTPGEIVWWPGVSAFVATVLSLGCLVCSVHVGNRIQDEKLRVCQEKSTLEREAQIDAERQALAELIGNAGVVFDEKTETYLLPKGRKYVSHQYLPDDDLRFVMRPMREGEFPETYEVLDLDGDDESSWFFCIREQA
jgi:hypothetical protein